MSNSKYAYRASDGFATALRTYRSAFDEFVATVRAWDAQHPDARLYVLRELTSVVVPGFHDRNPDFDPPGGLSRSQTRRYLIPKRGKAGDPWRAALESFQLAAPDERPVWRCFGVEPFEIADGHAYIPGFFDAGEAGVFVSRGVPFDPKPAALTEVALSEYYAAKEAATARAAV
jgi:hypothetical protein